MWLFHEKKDWIQRMIRESASADPQVPGAR